MKLAFCSFIVFCLLTFVICEELEAQNTNTEKLKTNYELAVDAFEMEDDTKALELLHIAAQESNDDTPLALYELGIYHQYGELLPLNYTKAIEYFNQSAAFGNTDAQFELGFMHSAGIGTDPSPPMGLLYYTFSSHGGNDYSDLALGYRYLMGHNVAKNCAKSALHYESAAARVVELKDMLKGEPERTRLSEVLEIQREKAKEEDVLQFYRYSADVGDAHAQVTMGSVLLQGGYGVEQDYQQAFSYFQEAANQGNAAGTAHLGFMYANGYGVEQNNETAVQLYLKAAAKGNAQAQTNLGFMYHHGYGVPKSSTEAFKYFKMAADQGYAEGLVNLASLYYSGDGVKQDYAKAFSYFSVAAQQGHVVAIFNLAQMHHHGYGTSPSCTMAVQLYKKVAERGPWEIILQDAQHSYENGDYAGALLRYEKAAQWGYELAQFNAGFLWEKGVGANFSRDFEYKKAFEYYRASAEQKNANSLLKLGDFHYHGYGTEVNYEKAAQYYQAASEMRNAHAMFNLGYMHQVGLGLPKDLHLAKRYYDLTMQIEKNAWMAVYVALGSVGYEFALDWVNSNPEIAGMQWDTLLIVVLGSILGGLILVKQLLRQN